MGQAAQISFMSAWIKFYFWFNQSGNAWSDRQVIPRHALRTRPARIWTLRTFSGPAPRHWFGAAISAPIPGSNYFALDFCGGVKPHLLVGMDNGIGAITRVSYAPSTRFALEDAAAGSPWQTSLPFPVQVVEKIEIVDLVSRCRHTTSYRYHHGFFDGGEREFRGFACVEQIDAEVFDDFTLGLVEGNPALNADRAQYQPPVLTRTWFHTGAWIEADSLQARIRTEFWGGDPNALQLADHDAPDDPEAFRALRGAVLRAEVYALDADPLDPAASKAALTFSVIETRYRVRQLQPRGQHQHGVFLASAAESITHHYERDPADPRITHEMTMPPDDFGNVTDKATIAYPRRISDAEVPEQDETKVVFAKSDFINRIDAVNVWLLGVPAQLRVFELTNVRPSGPRGKFMEADFAPLIVDIAVPFSPGSWKAFHELPPRSSPSKRLIEWTRNYFRKDAAATDLDPGRSLVNRLPLGRIEPLTLPYETLKAVFTKGLVRQVFGSRLDDPSVARAGYVTEADIADHWWLPSARMTFDPAQLYLPTQTHQPVRKHHDHRLRRLCDSGCQLLGCAWQ